MKKIDLENNEVRLRICRREMILSVILAAVSGAMAILGIVLCFTDALWSGLVIFLLDAALCVIQILTYIVLKKSRQQLLSQSEKAEGKK